MNDTPPRRPADMTFIGAHQAGGLPVALGTEAVAVGHQPLTGKPGDLLQPVQILERRGERA